MNIGESIKIHFPVKLFIVRIKNLFTDVILNTTITEQDWVVIKIRQQSHNHSLLNLIRNFET